MVMKLIEIYNAIKNIKVVDGHRWSTKSVSTVAQNITGFELHSADVHMIYNALYLCADVVDADDVEIVNGILNDLDTPMLVKKLSFQGHELSVPFWANFVTCDEGTSMIVAHEFLPVLDVHMGVWLASNGSRNQLLGAMDGGNVGMQKI